MAMLRLKRPALFLSAVLALGACEDGDPLAFLSEPADGTVASTPSAKATTTVERDVEAPDVFQATEAGLWDGRPSLGGVWVAHPDVREPERVLIRNETNDNFVIGALFRRERDNPGPRLQVSSDAADALGMLAGQPVRLNVTALRREEENVAAAAPQPDPVAEEEPPVIQAAAPATAPVTPPADTATDIAADDAPDAAPDIESEVETAAPAKKGFFASLFAPKPAETAPLDAIGPAETTALDAPPSVDTQVLDAPAPVPAPAPVSTSKLSQPFIQIGIFSVEQNAQNTATSLRRDGVVPTVLQQTASGKTFWRVVVGPMNTSAERTAILKKVKSLGYTDAYFVTN